MRLLVLGGTKFLGRAAVEAALARGHEVTLFNRGETNPELFPEAEKLRGDRTGDLSELRAANGTRCSTRPATSRASSARRPRRWPSSAGHYLFVSSISAYASLAGPVDEDSPVRRVGRLPDDALADDCSNYGALKALCEQAVEDTFGERATTVRAGPDRRAARPERALHLLAAPRRPRRRGARPARPTARAVHRRRATSGLVRRPARAAQRAAPSTRRTAGGRVEVLETCREVSGSDTTFRWIRPKVLQAHGVGEWMELPLWISDPESAGMHRRSTSRRAAPRD